MVSFMIISLIIDFCTNVKMADEGERKWNLLGVSKHYNWSLA